jgi:serine/threonine protein kinase
VTELLEGNLIDLFKSTQLSIFELLDIIRQIACGLNWLHQCQPPIVHLDLKLENVLYDRAGNIKLADFGLSDMLYDSQSFLQSCDRSPGNLSHMAPEVMKREKFSTKADVFSFGILMWEILTGTQWKTWVAREFALTPAASAGASPGPSPPPPAAARFKEGVIAGLLRPPIPDNWPPLLKRFVSSCWHSESTQRPTMDLVLRGLPVVLQHVRQHIVQHHLAADPMAAQFWSSNFIRYTSDFTNMFSPSPNLSGSSAALAPPSTPDPTVNSNSVMHLAIPWTDFFVFFLAHLNTHPSTAAASPSTTTAETATISEGVARLAFEGADKGVSFQRFCRIVFCFGPFERSMVDRIAALFSRRWFHPTLTYADAASYLQGQPPGTFVVRFSNQEGMYFFLSIPFLFLPST